MTATTIELIKKLNAKNATLRELLERCSSKIIFAAVEDNPTHSVHYKESLNELYRDIIAALEEK